MIPTREEQDALSASLAFKAVEMWVWNAEWEKRKEIVVGYDPKDEFPWRLLAGDNVRYAVPIQPKRRVPMDFRDKCRVVADGGELGINLAPYGLYCMRIDSPLQATHYRPNSNSMWKKCEKEVEE